MPRRAVPYRAWLRCHFFLLLVLLLLLCWVGLGWVYCAQDFGCSCKEDDGSGCGCQHGVLESRVFKLGIFLFFFFWVGRVFF